MDEGCSGGPGNVSRDRGLARRAVPVDGHDEDSQAGSPPGGDSTRHLPGRRLPGGTGGISAAVVAHALSITGRDDVAVYDGSLEEWSTDAELPLELGLA
jgi:hypothetical protein